MFGISKGEETKSPTVVKPLLFLSKVNFNYGVGSNSFRNFSYTIDVNLSSNISVRPEESQRGIEAVVDLLDGSYPNEQGFKRSQNGDISADSRKIRIAYKKTGEILDEKATVDFCVHYDGETINRAYSFVYLSSSSQEEFFSSHNSIIKLGNMKITKEAADSIEMIERIKRGEGPSVQNFLLN